MFLFAVLVSALTGYDFVGSCDIPLTPASSVKWPISKEMSAVLLQLGNMFTIKHHDK